jgi:hypothetical protein
MRRKSGLSRQRPRREPVEEIVDTGPPHDPDAVIQTIGLTKRYGARTAVDSLNLAVRRGEIFGPPARWRSWGSTRRATHCR